MGNAALAATPKQAIIDGNTLPSNPHRLTTNSQLHDILNQFPKFCGKIDEDSIIGTGHIGQVFRSKISNDQEVAVKRIEISLHNTEANKKLLQEASIDLFTSLDHQNVVKLMSIQLDRKFLYLVMELIPGENLRQFIRERRRFEQFPENLAKSFTAQVLRGLDYLHSNKILHRNLKATNVLLRNEKEVTIADYSLGNILRLTVEGTRYNTGANWHYIAPEVVRSKSYSIKSDIWSVGVLLIQMLCGEAIFSTTVMALMQEYENVGRSIFEPRYVQSARKNLPEKVCEFLDKIFVPCPAMRPSASSLLALDYLSDCETENIDIEQTAVNEYSLNKKFFGRMLIISTTTNQTQNQPAESVSDAETLEQCFKKIGFHTTRKQELDFTANDIIKSIEEFAQEDINEEYSCFIIGIVAYGSKEGILGADNRYVKLQDILKRLTKRFAIGMDGKPKAVIIQLCPMNAEATANNMLETTKSVDDSYFDQRGNYSRATDDIYQQILVDIRLALGSGYLKNEETYGNDSSLGIDESENNLIQKSLDEDASLENFAPDKADILIGYSLCSSYSSDRSPSGRSIFIDYLCKALETYWRKISLLDIMSLVSGDIARSAFKSTKSSHSQMPLVLSTLRKKFFLSTPEMRSATNTSRDDQINPTASKDSVKHMLLVSAYDKTFVYDPAMKSWSRAQDMLTPRLNASATFWKGKVVVAGGYITNTAEQYDPETNTWTALPAMQNCRSDLVLVTFDDALFAVGGWDGTKVLRSVEKYEANRKAWFEDSPLNIGRHAHCLAVLKNIIITAGGSNDESVQNSAEFFNCTTRTWIHAASLQTARFRASAAAVSEKVFVFGGRDKNDKYLDSIEQYDYTAVKWTVISARISAPKYATAAANVNGQIYIVGGTNKVGENLNSVDYYETNEDKIIILTSLPCTTAGAAAASVPLSYKAHKLLFKT